MPSFRALLTMMTTDEIIPWPVRARAGRCRAWGPRRWVYPACPSTAYLLFYPPADPLCPSQLPAPHHEVVHAHAAFAGQSDAELTLAGSAPTGAFRWWGRGVGADECRDCTVWGRCFHCTPHFT